MNRLGTGLQGGILLAVSLAAWIRALAATRHWAENCFLLGVTPRGGPLARVAPRAARRLRGAANPVAANPSRLAAPDSRLVAVPAGGADALIEELVALLRFVLHAAVLAQMAPFPAKRCLVGYVIDLAGHALLYPMRGLREVAVPDQRWGRKSPRRRPPTSSEPGTMPG